MLHVFSTLCLKISHLTKIFSNGLGSTGRRVATPDWCDVTRRLKKTLAVRVKIWLCKSWKTSQLFVLLGIIFKFLQLSVYDLNCCSRGKRTRPQQISHRMRTACVAQVVWKHFQCTILQIFSHDGQCFPMPFGRLQHLSSLFACRMSLVPCTRLFGRMNWFTRSLWRSVAELSVKIDVWIWTLEGDNGVPRLGSLP